MFNFIFFRLLSTQDLLTLRWQVVNAVNDIYLKIPNPSTPEAQVETTFLQ